MTAKMKSTGDDLNLHYFEFHYLLWKGSIRVQQMSRAEAACYLDLLIHCFDRGGFKDDLLDICYICNKSRASDMAKWWAGIKDCFYFEDGLWRNRTMDTVKASALEKVAKWREQNGGKAGAGSTQEEGTLIASASQDGSNVTATSNHEQYKSNHNNIKKHKVDKMKVEKSMAMEDKDEGIYPDSSGKPEGEQMDPPAAASSSSTAMDFPNPAGSDKDIPAVADEDEEELPDLLPGDTFKDLKNYKGDDFPAPIPLGTLEGKKTFKVFEEMRVAAMPPAASKAEEYFFAPWTNPHFFGNYQNLLIALMDQMNLFVMLPSRANDKGFGEATYHRLMPFGIDSIHKMNHFILKVQLALHFLNIDGKAFKFIPQAFMNPSTTQHIMEEKAYKMLQRVPFAKTTQGIPVMLLVTTGVGKGEMRPALIYGWHTQGRNSICRPVYILLDQEGNRCQKTYSELEDFQWTFYDWTQVKKGLKARDSANRKR